MFPKHPPQPDNGKNMSSRLQAQGGERWLRAHGLKSTNELRTLEGETHVTMSEILNSVLDWHLQHPNSDDQRFLHSAGLMNLSECHSRLAYHTLLTIFLEPTGTIWSNLQRLNPSRRFQPNSAYSDNQPDLRSMEVILQVLYHQSSKRKSQSQGSSGSPVVVQGEKQEEKNVKDAKDPSNADSQDDIQSRGEGAGSGVEEDGRKCQVEVESRQCRFCFGDDEDDDEDHHQETPRTGEDGSREVGEQRWWWRWWRRGGPGGTRNNKSGGEDGGLISPCACTGSMKYVHLRCLRQWQRVKQLEEVGHVAERCQVCKQCYAVPKLRLPWRDRLRIWGHRITQTWIRTSILGGFLGSLFALVVTVDRLIMFMSEICVFLSLNSDASSMFSLVTSAIAFSVLPTVYGVVTICVVAGFYLGAFLTAILLPYVVGSILLEGLNVCLHCLMEWIR